MEKLEFEMELLSSREDSPFTVELPELEVVADPEVELKIGVGLLLIVG